MSPFRLALLAALCASAALPLTLHAEESACASDWTTVDAADLAARRAGARVGPLEVEVGLTVRDLVDGREVLASNFTLDGSGPHSASTALPDPEAPGGTGIRLHHELTRRGVKLLIENRLNSVTIAREATLALAIPNFDQVMGNASHRAALGLAQQLGSAPLYR
jgi:hypothetical protein